MLLCRQLLIVFLLQSLCWVQVQAGELPAREQQRVDYLLASISELPGAVFIRNGTEHSAVEAADHLAMKLQRAKNSWFAPAAETWTAELFIEKLATRSSLSGKAYRIRFADGSEADAGHWLREQLENYEANSSSGY